MSNHTSLSSQSLALLTDFYQLTMAYAYWKTGMHRKESVFHLFFRKKPFNGGFTVAAGLNAVIDYVKRFRFDGSDIAYLASLREANGQPVFESAFLTYLENLRFNIDLDAVPEGTAVFPFEPLIRVQGELLQCQLLESPLLNLINFPTLIATKAARICLAAKDDSGSGSRWSPDCQQSRLYRRLQCDLACFGGEDLGDPCQRHACS
jgi:nicotinate phosphoribosyltransferase